MTSNTEETGGIRKTITLIRGTNGERHHGFQQRIWALADQVKKDLNPQKCSFTITLEPPPPVSIIPFKRKLVAAFTVWGDPGKIFTQMSTVPGFSGFYQVEEALPVAYSKTWDDETVTPGICLLTLFQRKSTIDQDLFLDRWHNSHTPLSLKIHPLWHYNRNVVLQVGEYAGRPVGKDNNGKEGKKESGKEGARESGFDLKIPQPMDQKECKQERWDGIVEEHMRERKDLLNPFRFFGNPLVIVPRMIEVYRDTNSFLDYKTIEPYLVREFHIVS